MKKLNFLLKTFSLLMVVFTSVQFSDLNAQAYVNEDIAITRLTTKLYQLDQAPIASASFPDKGVTITGDPKNVTRKQYYSMILENLLAKNPNAPTQVTTTKGAYEATKAFWNSKPGPVVSNPNTTAAGPAYGWMHAEALQLLTN